MLGRFWQIRGYAREGIGWLEMALVRSEATSSAARAQALNWLGQFEAFNGNLERACPALEESIAHARRRWGPTRVIDGPATPRPGGAPDWRSRQAGNVV